VSAIRDLQRADLDAALAINNANVPAVNELDLGELTRLHGFAAAALGADRDTDGIGKGGLGGFCLVYGPGEAYSSFNYRWFSAHYDDFVYLDRIAVAAGRRRTGIGRQLYTELVERFTGRYPVLLCEVNVQPRNDASLAFHHTIGFREVGQQDTDPGKRVSLLELRLV
jgi:uncharacterized protein